MAMPTNDVKVVLSYLRKNIFTKFGTPQAILCNEGNHFCNKYLATILARYGVIHKVTTTYHPQASGQVKFSNCKVKRILEKVVYSSRKDWSKRLDDAL